MGKLTTGYRPDPFEPYATATLGAGLLKFQYCESGPGHKPAEIHPHHCMVIPVQDEAIRIIVTRDSQISRFTLHRDDIALAPAGSEVSWQWLDPAKVVLIWIDPPSFERFVEIEMKLLVEGSTLENEIVISDPDLRAAAERMRQTLIRQEVGSDIVFDALARVFLVILVRRYGRRSAEKISFGSDFGVRDYTRVIDFVEGRLDQKITPQRMAEVIGMSEAVFARKFKTKVGKTPMAFVTEVRLETATTLMADPSLSLAEIAARCGFSDQAHFSRNFKKSFGVAPGKFRSGKAGIK